MADREVIHRNRRIPRRTVLQAAVVGGIAAVALPATARAADPVPIVVSGAARAVILVPPSAPALVNEAANELATYVQKSTGEMLPIMTEAQLLGSGTQYNGYARIYVGFVGAESDPTIPSALTGLDGDGYVIRTFGNTVTIIGPTVDGTRFGAVEFLERFVGVRWLMPTAIGDDVPTTANLTVPVSNLRIAPVYTSRQVSGVTTGPGLADKSAWLTRNRMHGRISFHHSLHSMFPPSLFATSHPEYYPILSGVRYIPQSDPATVYKRTGWQPSFSEPGTVDVAVQYILDFFDSSPSAASFSLGINDSGGFSEADPNDPGGLNSQGYVGKSGVYYAWVNDVVSQVVAAGHGDKKFGLLAYTNVADPPATAGFTLDPHVVPFFTRDRYGWVDPVYEQEEHAALATWNVVATQVAWYDYLYGAPYAVPRVFPHQMAETYAYGAAQDVRAAYAEVYPNWGEGAKPWLFLKLLWNPNQNVDTLLDEWYLRAVGSAAAPYLKQYYQAWETFWTQTVPSTLWFADGRDRVYFPFNEPSYLAAVTPALITQTNNLMASVVSQSATASTAQKQRVAMLNTANSYYQASAQSYPRMVAAPTTSAAALAVLDGLTAAWEGYEERKALLASFATDPLLYQHLKLADWIPWHPSQMWGVVDYCRANEPSGGTVRNRLQTDSTGSSIQAIRDFSTLALQLVAGTASQLMANPSFETASGAGAANWGLWVSSTGSLVRTTAQKRTGTASIVAHLLVRGGPAQSVPVSLGLFAARTYVFAPSGSQWNGTVQFALNLFDANNVQIGAPRGEAIPVAPLAGSWKAVDGMFDIPAAISGKTVVEAQVVVILDNFGADPDVYLDDVTAYQAQ